MYDVAVSEKLFSDGVGDGVWGSDDGLCDVCVGITTIRSTAVHKALQFQYSMITCFLLHTSGSAAGS